MPLNIEDELFKLKNIGAAELIVATFVSDDGDGYYTISFIGSDLPATAQNGFSAPSEGTNIAVIRSSGKYLILSAFAE